LEIFPAVKSILLLFSIAAATVAASAQNPSNSSSSTSPASAAKATPAATVAAKTTASSTAASEPWIKLPPGVPHVAHGPLKTPIALRYEEIKVGTGAEGEAGKLWHLKYTGWRAADGAKFDSWDEHPQPVMGPDGKPVMGPDGKPKMGDPQPAAFPQGVGRVIPGFDLGLTGMRIGGKRRIFIPWQLAYGTHSIPDRPDHPGIPAKADLIFDVELVEVTDAPPMRPMMPMNRPAPNAAPANPSATTPQPATTPSTQQAQPQPQSQPK
jgi:peptidylprolyl isomerase